MYSAVVTQPDGSLPSSQNLLYFTLTLGSATDAIFVHKVLTSEFILILSYLQMVCCHSLYQTMAQCLHSHTVQQTCYLKGANCKVPRYVIFLVSLSRHLTKVELLS